MYRKHFAFHQRVPEKGLNDTTDENGKLLQDGINFFYIS